jgi:hypothetical protein
MITGGGFCNPRTLLFQKYWVIIIFLRYFSTICLYSGIAGDSSCFNTVFIVSLESLRCFTQLCLFPVLQTLYCFIYIFSLSETTREEQRQLLLLNTVYQKLVTIKSRGGAQNLLSLLIGQGLAADSTQQQSAAAADSTQLLLLIKKWMEFLSRYKVR